MNSQTAPTHTDNGRRIDSYRLVDGRSWLREQAMPVSDRPEGSYTEGIWVASRTDTTPVHSTYPRGYDAACGWCWLGVGHSEAAHALRVA